MLHIVYIIYVKTFLSLCWSDLKKAQKMKKTEKVSMKGSYKKSTSASKKS